LISFYLNFYFHYQHYSPPRKGRGSEGMGIGIGVVKEADFGHGLIVAPLLPWSCPMIDEVYYLII
jgi:hypothetical protein